MRITDEQKQAAHEVDLVSYLESKGYEFNHKDLSFSELFKDVEEICQMPYL